MRQIKSWLGLALAAGLVAAGLAPGGAVAADPLKIGFVYVSPVGDAGWTYQHDQGRLEMERALGAKVETSYVESVPEGADAERVIRKFASDGYQLIFTTSFGYMNPTVKVARQFPSVHFEHATGYKRAKNVSTYLARFYEGRYLTGIVAGKMTKSNKIGYVAAFPIPEVVRGINAFTRGLRSVNRKAEVRVVWTSSWYDPGKEREAAETLISQGADVITLHTDSTAPVQAAEDKGVWAIGYHSDMSKYGKRAHLTAATHHWGGYYTKVAEDAVAGKWASNNTWGGIKDGFVKLAPFGDAVPADVRQLVKAREAEIAAGALHPFAGPVRDQAGRIVVAEGQAMSDKDMLGMKFYVEGVVGKLPK
ncbi:MAG: BMP family ABC transporter substrate-binding protein [Alphaproteobacteria bacterium]|nr:BMP family ABC transporter substrate-binding protein [Alphaproteobacteria bacterium]